jgi:hypothetical protein
MLSISNFRAIAISAGNVSESSPSCFYYDPTSWLYQSTTGFRHEIIPSILCKVRVNELSVAFYGECGTKALLVSEHSPQISRSEVR